jgi:hypothetical protein
MWPWHEQNRKPAFKNSAIVEFSVEQARLLLTTERVLVAVKNMFIGRCLAVDASYGYAIPYHTLSFLETEFHVPANFLEQDRS